MRSVVVLLSVSIALASGNTLPPEYKGCYSTTFVDQYAFYYKLNQSMNLEQGFAACNNRLTTYIGLQGDDSFTAKTFVYCGNDLTEVSPKLDSSECSTCQDNSTFSCGGTNSVAVYMLRESTPLALLLLTDRGIELLIDNITTVKVPPIVSSKHSYQNVYYIYTDDSIFQSYMLNIPVLRSFYNYTGMQYNQPEEMFGPSNYPVSFSVDFITHYIYASFFANGGLYQIYNKRSRRMFLDGIPPEQISIDPYDRIVAFIKQASEYFHPRLTIPILSLNDYSLINENFDFKIIKKIHALSIDTHDRYLYAVVNLKNYSTTHNASLVRLEYAANHMEVLSSGPLFDNTAALDVFRGHAVWLTNNGNISTIYGCKLSPGCDFNNLTTLYSSTQKIHDFTIYHPEKQTPGRKRLCVNITCSHGCQQFSPFAAKCSCPPGVELGSDNSPCNGSIFTWVAPRAVEEPAGGFSTRYAADNSRTHSSSVTPITQHLAPQAEAQPPSGSASPSTMEPMT